MHLHTYIYIYIHFHRGKVVDKHVSHLVCLTQVNYFIFVRQFSMILSPLGRNEFITKCKFVSYFDSFSLGRNDCVCV